MDRQQITKQIRNVQNDITRLSNILYAMETADIQRSPDNYGVLSMDAALRGERIAHSLRHLVYSTAFTVDKTDYLVKVAEIQGMSVEHSAGITEITLPCLLPKQRQGRNAETILDPLRCILNKYIENNPVPKFKECVVCFSHVYRKDGSMVRDYDNLELRQILNVIASYIMVDDSGLLCDIYHTTELGDNNFTRITVMGKNGFTAWLESKERRIKFITDI